MNSPPRWFRSLYWKLSAVLLALLAALGLVTVVLTLRTANLYFLEAQQTMHLEVAPHIASEAVTFTDGQLNQLPLEELFHDRMLLNPMIEIYLLDLQGRILAYSAPPDKIQRAGVSLEPIERFLGASAQIPILGEDPRHATGQKVFSAAPVHSGGRHVGYVYAILGGEQYESAASLLEDSAILRMGAWLVVGSLTLTGFAGLLAFRLLTRRLRQLRNEMESFAAGALASRAEPGANDEIGDLAQTYNFMAERIAEQVQSLQKNDLIRRELVANISHDLRTPAASIQGHLETLLIKESRLLPEERRRYLEIALGSAERLGRLVNELFELAKLDARDGLLRPESFSIAELVQDVAQKFQLRAQQQGVVLRAQLPSSLPFVVADIGLIERALENLLDNALRYTPAGGTVGIVLELRGTSMEVRVTDSGCGIAAADLPRVFERFYRVEKSRGERSGGSGLGLAITKRILDLHGSGISVASQPGVGTTFFFTLGVAPKAASAGPAALRLGAS